MLLRSIPPPGRRLPILPGAAAFQRRKSFLVDKILTSDPEIMHGTPCFTGTRVPVSVLFDNLASGSTLDEILDDFPTL
jgi:uncharacterized protein (DUF433 family)